MILITYFFKVYLPKRDRDVKHIRKTYTETIYSSINTETYVPLIHMLVYIQASQSLENLVFANRALFAPEVSNVVANLDTP